MFFDNVFKITLSEMPEMSEIEYDPQAIFK